MTNNVRDCKPFIKQWKFPLNECTITLTGRTYTVLAQAGLGKGWCFIYGYRMSRSDNGPPYLYFNRVSRLRELEQDRFFTLVLTKRFFYDLEVQACYRIYITTR